jgi:hypothetical protein
MSAHWLLPAFFIRSLAAPAFKAALGLLWGGFFFWSGAEARAYCSLRLAVIWLLIVATVLRC